MPENMYPYCRPYDLLLVSEGKTHAFTLLCVNCGIVADGLLSRRAVEYHTMRHCECPREYAHARYAA